MKKIYFRKCRIKSPHTGYKDCPCDNIVIDWDNIKLLVKKLINMKNKTLIIIGSIVGLLIIFYGLVIVPQNMQKRKIENEEKIRVENELKYSFCMDDAQKDYDLTWLSACLTRGLEPDCMLPSSSADSFNKAFKESQDRCVDLYN